MTGFLYTFLRFLEHTSEADCGAFWVDPDVSRPGIPSLLVYTSTGRVLGDSVHVFHRDLGREDCLNRGRNCLDRGRWLFQAAKNQIYPTLGEPVRYRKGSTMT